MAKRKRLMPAQASYLASDRSEVQASPTPQGAGAAPIAQVASEASATAALEELSGVLENARAKGLMIEELSLDQIDETYLVRDRITQDEEDMQALMTSISARGQQTPIEVVKLDTGGKPYGLISGWRRLNALRRLYDAGMEPRFASVRARVVAPEGAEDAYVAMVEENEIRVNLSHYERARIALKAVEMGLYEDLRKAVLGLFGNASRTKRSKISSFATLVEAFDSELHHPGAISEKLGLALAQRLEAEAGFAGRLRDALMAANPAAGVREQSTEIEVLNTALQLSLEGNLETEISEDISTPTSVASPPAPRSATSTSTSKEPQPETIVPGVAVAYAPDRSRVELSGRGVDAELVDALKAWLATR